MKYKKGSARIVIIFPSLGIVIKFPRILIKIMLRDFFRDILKRPKSYMIKWFKYPPETLGGFQNLMLKGICDNWNEYNFYQNTHHKILQPTYFSLYGLLNIQRYTKQEKINYIPLFKHFMEISNGEIANDGHHFTNWRNFCFIDGKVKMVDYGSKKTQSIIKSCGEKIVEKFELQKVLQEK